MRQIEESAGDIMNESNRVFAVTAQDFDQRVVEKSREVPVLVDFWAEWCAPCKMLMPLLARLAEEADGKWVLAKVNTDIEQELAMNYQVRSLPTVKLFRNGEPVDEFMGAQPESVIREFVGRHVERESDRLGVEAERLHAAGDAEGALALMERALADDPDNPRVLFQKLGMLLETGDLVSVEQGLAELPIALGDSPEARKLRARLRFHSLLPRQAAGTDPARTGGAREQAAKAILEGAYDRGLDLLFELLRTDPGRDEGAPKDDLLAAFELTPNADLVAGYRRRMFNLLH